MKVCITPGCPALIRGTARGNRCKDCRAAAEAARGSRADRGYGAEHQSLRAEWQRRIDEGKHVLCWRCDKRIIGTHWHLGHDDTDRSITRGPECVKCNLRAAGRSRH